MTPPAILDADTDKGGVQSDYRTVIAKAIDEINNKNGREFRRKKS